MGLGVGIFLVAVGAILAFAVHTTNTSGIDINTVGWILLAVGALGIVMSMVFWQSWAGPGYFNRRRSTTYNAGPGYTAGPGYVAPGYAPPPGAPTVHHETRIEEY